tara:strand:- start:899 stop:1582 length:684 start_codon:yes stop_codon:yes gene_type:complete
MSKQLQTAIADILAMPYFKNENARSGNADYGHEAAVGERISGAGFVEYSKDNYPKLKKGLLKKWAETGDDTELRKATAGLPVGAYILQPAGTQGFPDVLVKDFNDRFVAVECKSGQNGLNPMWNDNLPKPDTIYVLASGKMNATTIFLGKDVMTEAMLTSQQQMVKELKAVVARYKISNTALDQFQRGWDVKFRPQNFQSGGNAMTNYFTHPDRNNCEKNALEYAAQ